MAELKYFTLRGRLLTAVADETTDVDADPQVKGIYSGLTITPSAVGHPILKASTLTPNPAVVVLSPIEARIDNGDIALRADPDREIFGYANLAAFPATGLTTRTYRANDTGLVYVWDGDSYILSVDFALVRLVAKCSALNIGTETLVYELKPHDATFNGRPQELPTIRFAAPTIADGVEDGVGEAGEVVVDLATVDWITP